MLAGEDQTTAVGRDSIDAEALRRPGHVDEELTTHGAHEEVTCSGGYDELDLILGPAVSSVVGRDAFTPLRQQLRVHFAERAEVLL